MNRPPLMVAAVPYDACARHGGPAQSIVGWQKALGSTYDWVAFRREEGATMPYILERKVAACVRKGEIPIILGGDHSLTFSALKAITAHYGHVTVVHFDAHHDAYPGAALNHYTVFDIVCRKLPVSLVSVGYRYDSDGIPAQLESPITDRVYLSIDVDYFDPKYVPSVGHAVSCPPQKRYDLESFRESLAMIRGGVVGADIVEWCGDSAGEEEVRFVSAAFAEVVRVVSNDFN